MSKDRLSSEPYTSAHVLEKIAGLYGERGKVLVRAYQYFRWVDDIADSATVPKEQKFAFLARQKDIMVGIFPDQLQPQEETFLTNGLGKVGKDLPLLSTEGARLIETLEQDALYQPFHPRTYEQIAANSQQLMIACVSACNILFTGKPLKTSERFLDFLHYFNLAHSLRDFGEDLPAGKLQVGFTQYEVNFIEGNPDGKFGPDTPTHIQDRIRRTLDIYTPARFQDEIHDAAQGIRNTASAFMDTNIPYWQKLLCIARMKQRTSPRFSGFKINYPSETEIDKLLFDQSQG